MITKKQYNDLKEIEHIYDRYCVGTTDINGIYIKKINLDEYFSRTKDIFGITDDILYDYMLIKELKKNDYLNNHIANYYIDYYIVKTHFDIGVTYNFLDHIFWHLNKKHSFSETLKMMNLFLYFHGNMQEVKNDILEFLIIKKIHSSDSKYQLQGKLEYIKYSRLNEKNNLKEFKKFHKNVNIQNDI